MPILLVGRDVKVVRLSLSLNSFPALLAEHRLSDPTTAAVEQRGQTYVAGGYQPADTREFVRAVCRWGNYDGVAGNVLKHNTVSSIAAAFREGHDHVVAGRAAAAIVSVTGLKGLRISFGSKHLKFLAPDHAVVLDSIISERLGYPRTPDGYAEFVQDCASLRDTLNHEGIAPSPDQSAWRISDVEMAIFKSVNP
ncbi:hypothetical protein AAFN86_29270 [Roseomonas sp. CAU 1739]|uniref:hypothetical protein n=1 Tax=Roseomonas sp. CAU 1739 TaxID=3140364 RepID=UPI00325AE84A